MAAYKNGITDSLSHLSLEDVGKRLRAGDDDEDDNDEEEHPGGIEDASKKTATQSSVRVCVAAIDFGTTFSSIAYSFEDKLKAPILSYNKVISHRWNSSRRVSNKTPTSLLLDVDEEFVEFGYDAEERYATLANDKQHDGYRFFKHFKMMLHNNEGLKRDTVLKDDQGVEMNAIKVFAHCIRYLKSLMYDALEKAGTMIHKEEIFWVLTIPAIWNPKSKQFMREAAIHAGLKDTHLELALEPEAASVFVKEIRIEKKEIQKDEMALAPFEAGTKYIVLDLGGGTVDVSVREVNEDRTLKDLHVAAGNEFGGNYVNKEIWKFVEDLVGKKEMDKFCRESKYKAAVLDLEMSIEIMKCSLRQDRKGMVTLILPAALLEFFEKENKNTSLAEHVKNKAKVREFPISLKNEKLAIHLDQVVSFFKPSLENIMKILESLLEKSCTQGVKNIIMVGGFAACTAIVKPITELYKDKIRIFVPPEPELAVLKGAVMYRHWPEVVASRMCPYTYGSKCYRCFCDDYDDPGKKFVKGGTSYAKDVFNSLAKIGQEFHTGKTTVTDIYALTATMTKMSVHFFKSTDEDPKYCTDKTCTPLSTLVVEMPDTTGGTERYVRVSLTFGHTEIFVSGKHFPNGKDATLKLDLLS